MERVAVLIGVSLALVCQNTQAQSIDEYIEYANSVGNVGPLGPGGLPSPIAGDGSYITELDIREDQSNIVTSRKRRGAAAREEFRWRNKQIPYEIDTTGLGPGDIQRIQQAVSDWSTHTCLQFPSGRPQQNSNNYVYFTSGQSGCYSWVGSQHLNGKVNDINIYAPECRTSRVLLHLLGHTIGLYHEHSRPDRDEYLRVQQQNARIGLNDQFNIRQTNQQTDDEVQYDYRSIMHYGKNYLSKPNLNTLETVDPAVQDVIGNVDTLSFRDIKTVNLMYNCNEACPALTCPGEGFVGKDCQCWCPSDMGIYQTCQGEAVQEQEENESGCDQVFFQSGGLTGTFTSPNYPNNYEDKMKCIFSFRPRSGFSIYIRFDSFQLEGSTTCGFDYVKIGNKRYCGSVAPNEFIETSDVDIEFKTDISVTRKGFSASYTFISGEANCRDPGYPLNGRMTGDRFTYQSVVTYSCDPGYQLVGPAEITCQINGEWTADRPACRSLTCGDPGTPMNGEKMGTEYSEGSAVRFRCNDGYDLHGSSRVTCESNGLWSDNRPQCVPTCGRVIRQIEGMSGTFTSPDYPSNYGNRRQCTFRFYPLNGYSVRIVFDDFFIENHSTCDYDYLLIKTTEYCGNNRPNPVILTGDEEMILHSDYTVSAQGFSATYSFVQSSVTTSTARPAQPTPGPATQGPFTQLPPTQMPPTQMPPTQMPPTQMPPTQMPPTQMPPTQMPPTQVPPGTDCVDSDEGLCLEFQSLCAQAHIQELCPARCNICPAMSSSFTQSPPTQMPPTQMPPTQMPPTQMPPTQMPPTQMPPTQMPPTQMPPTQMPPTQMPPTQMPPTQMPPTQMPPTQMPPTQMPPTQAPPTQVPPGNGCVDSDVEQCLQFQSRCSFDSNIQELCPATCNMCPGSCPSIASTDLTNGQVSSTGNTFGSVVQFQCFGGYQIQGLSTITCLDSGQWSGPIPVCQEIQVQFCPDISELPNGQVTRPGGSSVGSTVEFACNSGFQLQGPSVLTCEPPGQWNGNLPLCEISDCADSRADCSFYVNDCGLAPVRIGCPVTCGACGSKRRKREVFQTNQAETIEDCSDDYRCLAWPTGKLSCRMNRIIRSLCPVSCGTCVTDHKKTLMFPNP